MCYDTLFTLDGTHIRGYLLTRLIGNGSFGAVYEGKCGLDTIAMKVSTEEEDLQIEAATLQKLYYSDVSPKFHFTGRYGPYHIIGLELVGPDLELLRDKAAWKSFKRHTLVRVTYQAMKCLEAVHKMRIVHRDVKLANFAVTLPTNPENRVVVKILDFGLSHNYADEDGTLREDSRNLDLRAMKYASHDVNIGCDVMPKDDICQLSFAVIYASGFDFAQQLKLPAKQLLDWKQELIRKPEDTLPHQTKVMLPFFDIVGELDDVRPINYSLIKERIQACMPEINVASDLILTEDDGEPLLV
ncbi:hypothetical protein B9Z55_026334 [Caenorhabditis nigoni]|uniref:Protein kinase domain-containing protein n=1 Tax=Caenorhabditis nigoni TaxID=1611254 RepID=A0A2G5T2U0_9PELO|nr:hypothetical protein B9Z55_026334 [Caenorhabditis nigoni]